jgi:transposase
MKNVRFVGLDVHAQTIAVAVAEVGAEVRSVGVIPNRAESVSKLIKKLGKPGQLRVCYEAGPTGYVLYWQLTKLGVHCEVVAPTLIPVKAGDRVKTDRRDAEKLARCYRAGDLTAVWVPDAAHEALRDLVRAREAAKQDQLRFAKARQLMGYSGAVSREDTSGDRVQRGAITKTGNAHLRRIVVEAAWAYRHRPKVGAGLAARQKDSTQQVKEIAWKAQHLLRSRYSKLLAKGKTKQKVITAVGRELLGFIWAIGVHVEQTMGMSQSNQRRAA